MADGKRSSTYQVRRIHRWLGLFIGIQFILWTVGGLYFSWTDLDDVHGDPLHAAQPLLRGDAPLATPTTVLASIRASEPVDSLVSVELVRVLGSAAYRVVYYTHDAGRSARKVRLADAGTGALRPALGREDAIRAAQAEFAHRAPVKQVEYLTKDDVGRHHEYREQPLPAWAVSFDHPSGATAYVAAEMGTVIRIRNGKWRTFDFLWMLHTMDYRGRDNFNNLLLRAFSVLGLVTVLSGFVLFALTSRPVRNRLRREPAGRMPRGT
jgi:uncharacterized iron-regulated membrane protein